MRKHIKKLLPQGWVSWLKCSYNKLKYYPKTNRAFKDLRNLMVRFSGTYRDDRQPLLSSLLVISHVLEKGITMPNRRLGFGYDRVRLVINTLNNIIHRFGPDSIEVQAAILDLRQYLTIHNDANYELPADIGGGIKSLLTYSKIDDDNCFSITKEAYFKPAKDFYEFAESRHSVRWFSQQPVDGEKLIKAIQLAQTAPSACNRQATRVKIVSSPNGKKLCCELQNGNRGFGNLADKWLIITSELGNWSSFYPQDPYVDGGIFTMNLLYALHYYGIVACTLNAHLDKEQLERLQEGIGYPKSEIPIAFIVIGNPEEKFMVPKSRRLKTDDIVQYS